MSTKTYGHLHEDDRAWFIADSFGWLVDQDRGEPMRAQKTHVCYACGGAIPAGERYRRLRGGDALQCTGRLPLTGVYEKMLNV